MIRHCQYNQSINQQIHTSWWFSVGLVILCSSFICQEAAIQWAQRQHCRVMLACVCYGVCAGLVVSVSVYRCVLFEVTALLAIYGFVCACVLLLEPYLASIIIFLCLSLNISSSITAVFFKFSFVNKFTRSRLPRIFLCLSLTSSKLLHFKRKCSSVSVTFSVQILHTLSSLGTFLNLPNSTMRGATPHKNLASRLRCALGSVTFTKHWYSDLSQICTKLSSLVFVLA